MKFNPRKLEKLLNYLPRWVWYLLSMMVFGPFGLLITYLVFYVLKKMIGEQDQHRAEDSAAGNAAPAYQEAKTAAAASDETERLWQQTQASAQRAYAAEPAPAPASFASENATVEDVIRSGQDAIRKIRRANDLIPDPLLSEQIDSIEVSCRQILSILEQRPQLLTQLRTFLRYYLPTTLRLLDARAKLENTANTPKAREVRARISDALGVIDKAFLKQVEALDEYRFIDLESEMDVLRDMLRADGLIDEEEQQENDPFADVLKAKNGVR